MYAMIGLASKIRVRGSGYDYRDLAGDVYGGVISAAAMLPLALAYGMASGLGAIAGLYGAIALGLLAAVAGGTRTMISGPTAPMAVTVTVVVAHYADDLADVFTIVMLAGLIQVALGVLKIGRFVSYTPYSVVSGFMTGVGVIVILLQSRPFIGLPVLAEGGAISTMSSWREAVNEIDFAALAVAATTLLLAAAWPRALRAYVPSVVAALVVGTALSALWLNDIPLIGDVPEGLPVLRAPDLSLSFLIDAMQPAATIALIGSIDTLLTAVVARSMTGQRNNPDRDLLGQGLGTLATGILGGLPGGASVCTIGNIRAGARSRVSGVLCALILLALVLGLGEYAESIPHAVLAGILIKIGWDFVDWRFMTRIHRVQREHLVIMMVTLVLTVFFDLITALSLGLIVAALSSARQFERLQLDSVVSTPLLDRTLLDAASPAADDADPFRARVGMVSLRGSFTVASSQRLMDTIGADIEEHEVVILDFTSTNYLDDSAALVVEHMVETAAGQDTHALVVGLTGQPQECLQGLGALQIVPEENSVDSLEEARQLAAVLLERPVPTRPLEA